MPFKPFKCSAALLSAALLAACAHPVQPLPAPPIVSVDAWGGSRSPAPPEPPEPQRINRITLHHQGETWQPSGDVPAYLKRLQQWSRLSKRWADIPYHYIIAPNGQIYAARDAGVAGDTNTEYKPEGHALVMVMGNFEDVQPTPAQLRSTVDLMAWLAQSNGLGVDSIASHKDYSALTVCPGKHLYAYLENGWLRRAVAARLAGQALPTP